MKQPRKAPSINAIYEREHFSQFYLDDDSLITNLRSFVAGGLSAGEVCIVVATKEHRQALEQLLQQDVANGAPLQMEGYRAFDAETTLATFMDDNLPNRSKFMTVIGGVLDGARKDKATVRAFGEMVALLWAGGNQPAAILLEQFWNEAMRQYSLTLFCAYPTHYFSGQGHADMLREVQRLHSSYILPSSV